ncbi:aromatic ring-hydroxylating dioxygenase subunit alpha [uncultured Sneathiella sp.]|jgi:methanesulfonate monooxygenase large subunit|uniref:aromatic ring-hydroxylating oxygenase subunit alpha n=1 Tax=uncultured Sneathiella sp. TaxID=879315 RepID=UPI0030ED7253|tara:strand:+ start:13617 stop:14810 length:1194 start_codon:yes stop_codon:yes gene_type:complete
MSRNTDEYHKKPPVPDTHYIDNRIYWDQDIFDEEQEKIFSKIWKFVCHESELPEPYDFRTTTLAGTPLIICRGTDGEIRTFINACSHRGLEIVRRPRGNAKSLECIFHRWTYDPTTGECTGIPRREAFEKTGLQMKDCGLQEFKTGVYLGLVFVTLNDDAESLEEFIGDALEMHRETLGTKPMEVFDFYEQVLPTNWKSWQETNMDLYHEFMHLANRKTGLTQNDYYERKWHVYRNGHAGVDRYKARYDKYKGWTARDESVSLPGISPNEFQIVNLYPDLAINARGTVIRIDSQIPLAPDKTLVQYRGLAVKGDTPAERAQRVNDYTVIWGPFGTNLAEDTLAVSLQARAVHGGQVPYTYWNREEDGLTHDDIGLRSYYREWERLMGRPASAPLNRG